MRRLSLMIAAAALVFASVLGYAVSQEPRNYQNAPMGYQRVDETAARRLTSQSSSGEVVGRYQFHVGNSDLSCGRSILVDTATGKCWLLRDWKEWKDLGSPADLDLAENARIAPGPLVGDVVLTIADLRDQLPVGKEVTYELRVTNNGTTEARQAVVIVTSPPEMTPISAGTGGPQGFVVKGQSVAFAAVPAIRAGETLCYQVRMRADQVGTARVGAQLRMDRSPLPITAEESTTIVPEGL